MIITSHQRDRLVLISAEEYKRLTEGADTPGTDRQRALREGLEYHRNTLVELAKR